MPIYEVGDPAGRIMRVEGASPPNPMQIKALFEEYDAEQAEDPFADERTFGGQVFETAKAIPRGFAGSFLTAGEGLAELADAATNTIGLEDLIDSGEDNAMVSLARDGRAALQESMGADEAYRDTWMTKFGEGLGSFASFFTPAAALKVAGATGKLASLGQLGGAGALAVGSGAGDQAQRIQAARDQGIEVSEGDEDLAIGVFGSVIGASELFAPTRILSRISKNANPEVKATIAARIKEALGTGVVEGVQEAVAGILQDATERGIYNENLARSDSMFDDFTVGGAVGTFADLALNGAAGRRRQMGADAQVEAQKNAKEILENKREALAQEVSSAQAVYEQELAARQGIAPSIAPEVDLGEIEAPRRGDLVGAAGSSGAYLNVVDREGNEFQAEEKISFKKGREDRYVRRLNDDGTFTNVVLSRGGVPVEGISSEVVLPAPENIPSRRSKDPMLQYARRIRQLAGGKFLLAGKKAREKAARFEAAFANAKKNKDEVFTFEGREYSTKEKDYIPEASFDVEEKTAPDGTRIFEVVANGTRYGRPFAGNQREEAISLAGNLNEQLSDAEVAQRINTAIDSFNKDRTARFNAAFINAEKGGKENFTFEGKEYSTEENNYNLDLSPEERSTMFAYGWKTLNIDQNTYTSAELNQAGGTTVIEGFNEQLSNEEINNTAPSKLTMSQRINKKRMAKGKTPTNSFTVEEVKDVLGAKFGNIRTGEIETETYAAKKGPDGNPVVVTSSGEVITGHITGIKKKKSKSDEFEVKPFVNMFDASLYAKKRNEDRNITSVDESVFANKNIRIPELNRLLDSKNIVTEVGSPEFRVLIEAFTGVKASGSKRIKDLTNAEMKILYQRIRSLPQFADPTPLVNFLPKKAPVIEAVQEEVVQEEVAPDGQPPLLLPQKTLGEERLEAIQKALDERMDKTGLGDIRATISRTLQNVLRNAEGELVFGVRQRAAEEVGGESFGGSASLILDDAPSSDVQAFYSTPTGEIFLGLDKIDSTLPIEQQVDAAIDLLSHEQVHAMRQANLFTDKEWSILSKAAENVKSDRVPDQTFLRVARENYRDLTDEGKTEEAVAELVRAARRNPKIISGKPKNLLSRIPELFARLKGFLSGSGYTTFEGLIADIESGAVGARERGGRLPQEVAEIVARGTSEGQRMPDFIPEVSEEVEDTVQLNDKYARMGVNVATDGDNNYSELIVSGQKRFETRDTDSLRPYVGEQVGIVETKKGQKAKLVGYATVGEPQIVDEAGFDALRTEHLVPKGSKFDIKQGQNKYLYEMVNPQKLKKPVDVSDTRGIVARNISSTPVLGDKLSKTLFIEGQKDSATTQVSNTVGSYKKAAKKAEEINPEGKTLLDYGAGLGLGSDAMRENSNLSVTSYEPFPENWKGSTPVDYTDSSFIEEKYDNVVNLNVLNVLEPDLRNNVAKDIMDKVAPGGVAIIGTRKWKGDIDTTKNFLPTEEDQAVLVQKSKAGETISVYQKGFDGDQLKNYITSLAPKGFRVERGQGIAANTVYVFNENSRDDVSPALGDKFSRTISIEDMTNTDLMPTAQELEQMKDGSYVPKKKRSLVEAVQFLQDRWEAATGRTDPFEYNAENKEIIAELFYREGRSALGSDSNAIGWYDRKIKDAKKIMGLVEPRIMKSPENEALFDFALAVTSNGQAVVDNFEMAAKVFRFYMRKGRFPQSKKEFNQGGERNAAMLTAFNFHNAYQRSGQNQPIKDFLSEDFTVAELRSFANMFNEQVGFEAMKVPSSEGANVSVKASYILGPKIGQGFYQNIRGNYAPLTMDIWWMRLWNRSVGRPFANAVTDEARTKRRDEIKVLMKKTGGLPKKLVNDVLKGNDQTREEIYQDPELFDSFIQDLNSAYQKFYKQYKIDEGVNHTKPEIFKKTGTYVKNLSDNLQAVPKGVKERAYMREVVESARERLLEDGFDITTADFQALMWYPEKQLFRALGVTPGRGSDNDYLDAAEALAEKEGISRGKIEKTLRDADRDRAVDGEPSTRGQDGSVRDDASRPDGQEEGSTARTRERADGSTVGGDPAIQKVTRDAGAVQKVVDKNEQDAVETPADYVPRFSFTADPEAQYIAQNPEEGITPSSILTDKFSRRNSPELAPEAQSAVSRLAAKPETDATPGETYLEAAQTFKGKLSQYLTKFKQETVNNYARLEVLNRDPAFKENLADTSSIAAALFADRSMGIVASALKSGVVVYQDGVTRVVDFVYINKSGVRKTYKGLVDVMAPLYSNEYNVSLEELAQAYAIAKRADRLRKQGLPVPTEAGDLAVLEAEIAKFKNKDGVSIIEEWYDTWQAYNNKTVDFMKATGIVDDALAQKWVEMSDYIPFYRQADAVEGETVDLGKNVPQMFKRNMTTAVKLTKLKGSEKAVNVPMLDAITRNLSMAIDSGMKNVAQQRIVRDMIQIGLAEKATPEQRRNKTQNYVVSFKVDGVDQHYSIKDPLIYESMQTIGAPLMGTSLVGGPSKLLREMITRDPGFMFANMMRDTLSAYVTSGANFIPVIDTVKNINLNFEELERFGVVGGYDFSNDPDDIVRAFGDYSKERGVDVDGTGDSIGIFKKLWNWSGNATTASDAATRKAVYYDVLARTGNEAEAAFQALEVINFSRRGRNQGVRLLTTAIPFLNARFQGLDVLYRGFMGYNPADREKSRRQATATALMRGSIITATTMAYWLMFSDDEEYKKATDEQRDLNWILPLPKSFGVDVPLRIPVPFEVGLLFKTIPERILDTYGVAEVFGKTGQTSQRELGESLTRGVGETLALNPLGAQIVAPLIEAVWNKNFYTGRDIVPFYLSQNSSQGLIARASNTEVSKWLGEATNISPMKWDHVMYGYVGTLGGYAIDVVDEMIFKNPAVLGDKGTAAPTKDFTQLPVMKRFFLNKFSSGDVQDFYDLKAEVKELSGDLKRLAEEDRLDEYEAVFRARGHLLAMKDTLNYTGQRLSELRKQRQIVERSDLSSDLKRDMIDEIQNEIEAAVRFTPILKREANLPVRKSIGL